MCTALLFMIGGILGIEYKRQHTFDFKSWSEELKAHFLLGSIAMVIFGIELIHNFFRPRNMFHRALDIVIHFVLGLLSYVIGGEEISNRIDSIFIQYFFYSGFRTHFLDNFS